MVLNTTRKEFWETYHDVKTFEHYGAVQWEPILPVFGGFFANQLCKDHFWKSLDPSRLQPANIENIS